MPRITGTGTNANGNNYTSYSDGSFHYNNSNGEIQTWKIYESNILNLFSGSSFAQNGAHEHYTTPDGNDGKQNVSI